MFTLSKTLLPAFLFLLINTANAHESSAKIKLEKKTAEQISSQQIANGSQVVPAPVLYRCSDEPGDVLTVYFYNQTKLPTVVVNYVPDQFTLYKTQSGSGAHYISDKAEFWEHHGEAIFTVEGKSHTCRAFRHINKED